MSDSVEPAPRQRRLMLAAMCGCVAAVFGLALGVIAILPAIGTDLEADQTELQWIADVFPLTIAALLLPAGAVLDRFGRKRGMLVGLAVLTGSLAWSALADSAGELIGARVASGVAMALVFPGTLATISDAIPGTGRMRAVGIWAVAGIVGGVGGMDLCALLADLASWREAFWAFAAVGVILFVLTAYGVPETRSTQPPSVDPLGVLLSIAGIGILVLGITEAPVHGWTGPVTVGGVAGGLLILAAFVLWELRHPRPLLDVRVYADARFSAASIATFGMVIADFAMIFLVFQYETYVLNYSPLKAAVGIAPPGLIMILVVPLALVLAPRWGERRVVTLALGVCAAGTLISALVAGANASYLAMVAGTILIWAGIGFGLIAPTVTILDGLPRAKQGVASALNDLTRELGAALGIAITGSAFNAAYRDDVKAALGDHTDAVSTQAVLDSPATGLAMTSQHDSGDLTGIIEEGVLQGWQTAFLVVSGVLILLAVCSGLLYPARNRVMSAPSDSVRAEPEAVSAEHGLAGPVATGVVCTVGGRRVPGPVVTLVDSCGREAGRTRGDEAGRFTLELPPPGWYLLVLSSPGWHPRVQQVLLSGHNVQFELALTRSAVPAPLLH